MILYGPCIILQYTGLVKIMLTLADYFSLQIDVRRGWQINIAAKKCGCKRDGSVWFANRSPSKVCTTICRTGSTKPFNVLSCLRKVLSVNIILTNPVYVIQQDTQYFMIQFIHNIW